MEARLRDNRIVLPIGTAIGFKKIAKNDQKIDLNLTEDQDKSKFYALFDENDVDFEIEVNNLKCIHGIGYTLIVNNGFYDYYIGPREVWTMEALYTRGRKLHFISENSQEGQNVIEKTAQDYDICYSESAAVCSRIEFNFEVEKSEQKIIEPAIDVIDAHTLEAPLDMFPSVPPVAMASTQSSRSCDLMTTDAALQVNQPKMLAFSLGMAAQPDRLNKSKMSSRFQSDALKLETRSLSQPFTDVEAKDQKERKNNDEDEAGDRGVVCFGQESNQLYNPYGGFTKDKDLVVKPFVVELRFSKK